MHERLTELLKNAGFSDSQESSSWLNQTKSGPESGQGSGITQAVQQATEQLAQLRTATQGSVDLIASNTDAVEKSTQSQPSNGGGVASLLGEAAKGLLGGGGLLSGGILGGGLEMLFSSIAGLFGKGTSEPPPLTQYEAPESQSFQLATSHGITGDAVYDANGQPRVADFTELALSGLQPSASFNSSGNGTRLDTGQTAPQQSPQITVQVQAMDSRSFLDHSQDIALAVRDAMLNMHSINDVMNDL